MIFERMCPSWKVRIQVKYNNEFKKTIVNLHSGSGSFPSLGRSKLLHAENDKRTPLDVKSEDDISS